MTPTPNRPIQARDRRPLSRWISTSEKVDQITTPAALLYSWLVVWPDDHGRFEASPATVKAKVVPMRDDFTKAVVTSCLDEMEAVGLIVRYEVNGKQYLEITNWDRYQSWHGIRQSEPFYPPPMVDQDTRDGGQGTPIPVPKGSEVKVKGKGREEPPIPPRGGNEREAESLVDHYRETVKKRGNRKKAIDRCKARLRAKVSADDLRLAIDQCRQYLTAKDGNCEFAKNVDTFFGDGHWNDGAWWPEVTARAGPAKMSAFEKTRENLFGGDDHTGTPEVPGSGRGHGH